MNNDNCNITELNDLLNTSNNNNDKCNGILSNTSSTPVIISNNNDNCNRTILSDISNTYTLRNITSNNNNNDIININAIIYQVVHHHYNECHLIKDHYLLLIHYHHLHLVLHLLKDKNYHHPNMYQNHKVKNLNIINPKVI